MDRDIYCNSKKEIGWENMGWYLLWFLLENPLLCASDKRSSDCSHKTPFAHALMAELKLITVGVTRCCSMSYINRYESMKHQSESCEIKFCAD